MSDYIDIQDVYLNHDLCGVERNTSISLLGRLTPDEMEKLDSVQLDLNEVGWPSEINETDIEFNKRFNIDLDESVKDEDFVKMSDLPFLSRDEKNEISELLKKRFPDLKKKRFQVDSFSTYFAHLHSDKDLPYRAQINLILDNPAEHKLISISANGDVHVMIPKKGDIVFLDVYCQHAVWSNQDQGYDVMRKNSMVAIFLS